MEYPLVFKTAVDITCPDWAARVVIQGRVLMVFEDDEWWCHGVEPGGMTEHHRGPPMAFASFRQSLGQILCDIAAETRDFDAFVEGATKFVTDVDTTDAKRWEEARVRLRDKDLEFPFSKMPKQKGEWKTSVTVERLEQLRPIEEEQLALAQAPKKKAA